MTKAEGEKNFRPGIFRPTLGFQDTCPLRTADGAFLTLADSFLDVGVPEKEHANSFSLCSASFTYSSDDKNARMDTFQRNEQLKMLPV